MERKRSFFAPNRIFQGAPRLAYILMFGALVLLVLGDVLDSDEMITWARRLFAGVMVFILARAVMKSRSRT